MKLRELKKGDFFTFKDYKGAEIKSYQRVYIRGDYDRSTKRYEVVCFQNCVTRLIRGDKEVFTDFIF